MTKLIDSLSLTDYLTGDIMYPDILINYRKPYTHLDLCGFLIGEGVYNHLYKGGRKSGVSCIKFVSTNQHS